MKQIRARWLKDKKINLRVQMSIALHPELMTMGVPFIMDYAKTEDQKAVLAFVFSR